MSEVQSEATNEVVRAADRYAAELVEKYGMPLSYDAAVEMVAVAYVAGSTAELKWARDLLRGDAA